MLDWVISSAENLGVQGFWGAMLIILIVYLFKKEPFKILVHFQDQKQKDISQMLVILKSEAINHDSRRQVSEYLERYLFRKLYRINAGARVRKTLTAFYEKHQNGLGWHDLRRAFPYMIFENGELGVNVRLRDKIWSWVVKGFSFLIGLYSVLVIVAAFLSLPNDQAKFSGLLFGGILLFFSALVFSSLSWPYQSAKKIEDLIASESCQ